MITANGIAGKILFVDGHLSIIDCTFQDWPFTIPDGLILSHSDIGSDRISRVSINVKTGEFILEFEEVKVPEVFLKEGLQ